METQQKAKVAKASNPSTERVKRHRDRLAEFSQRKKLYYFAPTATVSPYPKYYKDKEDKGILTQFARRLKKKKLEDWEESLRDLSVRTVITFVNKKITKTDQNPFATRMHSKESEKGPKIIQKHQETDREFQIHWVEWNNRNSPKNSYNLFTVKRSTIPGAGYGLFAAQNFREGDYLGVYYGRILGKKKNQKATSTS